MKPVNQSDHQERSLRELLQENIPPISSTELSRDLWPQMLEKLNRQSGAPWPARVPWFDWALAAAVAAALLAFPGIIPALFYHF